MKILKFLVLIILMFLLIVFVVQNYGQIVHVKFIFSGNQLEMELVILLFITLLIGLIIGFLYSALHILSAKSQLKTLNKEYEQLKKEVDLLRNQGIIEDEFNQ